MTTIEIVQEQVAAENPVYRAICGPHQATGLTPGEALDTLERRLATQENGESEGTVVAVQRFRPDEFFPADRQARLRELMDRFHAARATGQELAPTEKSELERLVDAEWQAAIARAGAILKGTQHSES